MFLFCFLLITVTITVISIIHHTPHFVNHFFSFSQFFWFYLTKKSITTNLIYCPKSVSRQLSIFDYPHDFWQQSCNTPLKDFCNCCSPWSIFLPESTAPLNLYPLSVKYNWLYSSGTVFSVYPIYHTDILFLFGCTGLFLLQNNLPSV